MTNLEQIINYKAYLTKEQLDTELTDNTYLIGYMLGKKKDTYRFGSVKYLFDMLLNMYSTENNIYCKVILIHNNKRYETARSITNIIDRIINKE